MFDLALEGTTLLFLVKSVYDPNLTDWGWLPKGYVSGGAVVFPPKFGPMPPNDDLQSVNRENSE